MIILKNCRHFLYLLKPWDQCQCQIFECHQKFNMSLMFFVLLNANEIVFLSCVVGRQEAVGYVSSYHVFLRGCGRETRLSSKRRRLTNVWSNETQLSGDSNMKESRLFMYILKNSDLLFRFEEIYVCKCIYILFYFLFHIMVNNKHGKQNRKKCGIYKSITVCRFEIIDGVKYVYCIKHVYRFLLRKRLRQCVSCLIF